MSIVAAVQHAMAGATPAAAAVHTAGATPATPAAATPAAATPAAHEAAAGGGAMGGKLGKMSSMMAGGIPCGYELPMEFFVGFLFTFLIYFLVFGFVPYHNIVSTMTKYIIGFPEKMYNKFLGTLPSSVKNAQTGSIFSGIQKVFTKTIPDMIQKEKTKLLTPLQKKLQQLKDKENSKSQNTGKVQNYITKTKIQIISIWETLRHKIIPAIFISIIYYVIWIIIFKIIPQIMKYGINMATKG